MLIDATTILVGGQLGLGIAQPASMIQTYEDSSAIDYSTGITIEQGGTGDAALHFELTGGDGYAVGIDNSLFDRFVISLNTSPTDALGTGVWGVDNQGNMYVNYAQIVAGGRIIVWSKTSGDTIAPLYQVNVTRDGGAAGGAGLGVDYLFKLANSIGIAHEAGKFEVVWTDATSTNEDSSFGIYIMVGGTFTEVFQCNATAVDVTSAMRIGDGGSTHYTEIKADGEINLHGTARVKKQIRIDNAHLGKGATAASQVIIGNYTAWEYDVNDDSVFTFHLPNDWASGTDFTINIDWYINEAYAANSGEIKWEVSWSATPHDDSEAIDAPTHTGSSNTGDVNIPATTKHLTSNSLTISGASLSAGDQIGVTLKRIAITDGINPAVDPGVVDLNIEYTADKLGEAT